MPTAVWPVCVAAPNTGVRVCSPQTAPPRLVERNLKTPAYAAILIFCDDLYSPEKRLTVPIRTCRGRAPETSPDHRTRQIAPLLCGRFLYAARVIDNRPSEIILKVSYSVSWCGERDIRHIRRYPAVRLRVLFSFAKYRRHRCKKVTRVCTFLSR